MAKRRGPGRDAGLERRWRGLMGQWRKSGLGVRAFCRKAKVAESGFYYWRRELDRRRAQRQKGRPKSSRLFVPVTVGPEGIGSAHIEVRLRSGIELRAPASMDAEHLARVALALDRPSC